jgi:hypothetical protein
MTRTKSKGAGRGRWVVRGVALAAAAVTWRRARTSDVTSLRKIANQKGITTWTAWRKGRVR